RGVRRGRRPGPRLPAGGDRCRFRLHGGARRGALPDRRAAPRAGARAGRELAETLASLTRVPTDAWVDLLDPSAEQLTQRLPADIHDRALEQLLEPIRHGDEPRPRLESQGD